MKLKFLLVCLAASTLLGCGNTWYLNGKSKAQYSNDVLECQALDGRMTRTAPGSTWGQIFNHCMQGKGYTTQSNASQSYGGGMPPPSYSGTKLNIDQAIAQCNSEGIKSGTTAYGLCVRKYTQE